MTPKKYHGSMIIFHWLIALLMITVICLAIFYWGSKTFQLPFSKDTIFSAFIGHETFGFFLLVLTSLRVANTYVRRDSRPESMNPRATLHYHLEKSVHLFLQYGVVVLTLLGWATANAKGYELRLFWNEALTMPNIVALGNPEEASSNNTYQWLLTLHSYMAFTMIAVVIMHIGAVVLHRWQGHPIIQRMMFR